MQRITGAIALLLMFLLSACGGSDDNSSTTTSTVTAPTITTQPSALTVTAGAAATFTVVASGTSLTYQWYKTGAAISGATASTYTISATSSSDAATYYVVVTNSAGSVTSSSVALTVNAASTGAPTITTQPVSSTVAIAATATFTVVASGSATLTYQWYKDSAAISGATSATYSIASAATTDAGSYYVVVTNSLGSVTSSTVTLTVSASTSGSNTAAVVTAANAFLATLTSSQLTTAELAFTLPVAETWSNLPGVTRNGPTLGGGPAALSTDLTTTQRTAALALAQAALSSAGYTMMAEIRAADDVIRSTNAMQAWNSGNYHVAILGTPSTTAAWMLQISGHHLAYNITYNGTYVSATPMFIGVEPPNWTLLADGTTAVVEGTVNGVTEYSVSTPSAAATSDSFTTADPGVASGTAHAALETQRAAVSALAIAIQADTAVSTAAKLSGTFDDVAMGVGSGGNDTNYPFTSGTTYPTGTSGRGVLYSSLSSAEQAQVQAVIAAWVSTQASDIQSTLLATYESTTALSSTYVAYGVNGTTGTADFSAEPNELATPLNTQHSYLRIDGPRVWIEFVVQEAVAFANESWVHYHSIWRDKTADYGGCFSSGASASTC